MSAPAASPISIALAAKAPAATVPTPAAEAPKPKQLPKKIKRKFKAKEVKPGSSEEILVHDVQSLLKDVPADVAQPTEFERFQEVELTIADLSSTGDGLAATAAKDHVVVVPFCLPGEVVKARIHTIFPQYSLADLVQVITKSPQRHDELIGCKYYGKCGGCQFQTLTYEDQLIHKKRVVEKAFANFSGLPAETFPPIIDTCPSPLQYRYRTKITPHFDTPRAGFPDGVFPQIGFMEKGRRRTMDIEECPIATEKLNEELVAARRKVYENVKTYKKGATLLLRESTTRTPSGETITTTATSSTEATRIDEVEPGSDPKAVATAVVEEKLALTDSKQICIEYVDEFRFETPAGSFFQNNNAILPAFTGYVRDNLRTNLPPNSDDVKHLVDAYCGSGLFAVTCHEGFESVVGVEISSQAIEWAKKNAASNGLTNTHFRAATASHIFEDVRSPPLQTAIIIDPPRSGCDHDFLNQLLTFGPRRVVYISCNVHTQARDIGYLLKHEKGKGKWRVDSIRGFDLFPQTHHVETIAVLTRIDDGKAEAEESVEGKVKESVKREKSPEVEEAVKKQRIHV
ncbi:S-adenosyl-L-methionine-dependent methyltransferase [Saitoella complicata NRRL Y-17804]|uniref:TRAM domain-containing protein n=1 Tax=Saitoella complicata (strain BCRC 22490 / CBS 7301 / JCM 7358 / NBRC 10748 / NRRL Y-17804) TaxID=698492 RepID=A0A0E9NIL6_SAICN|nr:S-adenosyl-L-methionine-dependent methyltransferase [Saitoella complicata NRRL Y-17804]ODQ52134.1 S-adenosyl-L-methionine-dependent methyltransferase [Saitoella complicata NRRL Y-17804]GAO49516.1 hypothetical protein G7K_3665-t1 [Saitoella complicata NRRL Y-17804]